MTSITLLASEHTFHPGMALFVEHYPECDDSWSTVRYRNVTRNRQGWLCHGPDWANFSQARLEYLVGQEWVEPSPVVRPDVKR